MELQKGVCFLCHNNKVITTAEAENAFDIICSLFSKEKLNIVEIKNIQSSLRFCPICFHKLTILEYTNENIKKNNNKEDEDAGSKCVLCKSGKVLFKINDWPLFNKISEDLVSKDEDARYITCSDCLFYLDTRNQIKSKLVSKYPQLRVKSTNGNENKRKSANNSTVLPDSTEVSEGKRRRRTLDKIKVRTENDKTSQKQKSINYDSLKKLKPLKHNRTFGRQEIVKSDSKFLNQIPCVLLKTSNFSNKLDNNSAVIKSDDKGISPNLAHKEKQDVNISKHESASPVSKRPPFTLKIKMKPPRIGPKSIKLKRAGGKQHIVKDLVVNLTKMNILQKHKTKSRNYKADPEIEKLIFKFNVLQRPTTASTSKIVEENFNDDYIDLTKDTNNVKSKRKSVSFAEDKNVEIEYYQNDSKINSNNLGRGKRSDVPEKDVEVEKENKESIEESKDDENCIIINDDDVNTEVTTKSPEDDKYINQRNSVSEEEKLNDKKAAMNGDEKTEITEVDKVEVQNKRKREKPKPLSKKKSVRPSGGEDTTQEQEKEVEEEADEVDDEKTPKKEKPKPLSKKKSVKPSSGEDTTQEQEKEEVEKEADEVDAEKTPKKEKPKPLSKKKSVKPLDGDETTQEQEKEEVEKGIDEVEVEKTPKKEKPKPLSKKKSVKPSDGDETAQESEKGEVEKEVDESDVEKTPKKEKPKPLSKKKTGENSPAINLDSTTDEGASKDTNSETDKEPISPTSPSKEEKDDGSDTLIGSADQIAGKDDDNASSNEQKEFCKEIELDCKTKATDADGDSGGNAAANDESADEETKKDETDESKENGEEKSLSTTDNANSTNGKTDSDVEEGIESSSKNAAVNEDNKDERISDAKEDEDDDSKDGNENDESKETSSTQLDDSKDMSSEENVNSSNKDSGNGLSIDDENKKSDEGPTGDSKTDDNGKKVESFDSNSFSDSEKNDELGITEDDTDNINSIITGMFSNPDQPDDNWKTIEKDSDDKTNNKRKASEDELNDSTDKKKKKVTFCEDLT